MKQGTIHTQNSNLICLNMKDTVVFQLFSGYREKSPFPFPRPRQQPLLESPPLPPTCGPCIYLMNKSKGVNECKKCPLKVLHPSFSCGPLLEQIKFLIGTASV
jgi:hypothetical protein